MRNYANKILSELVGGTSFFQYENISFQRLYPQNPYDEIKRSIINHSDAFLNSFYQDLNFLGLNEYKIESITGDSHNGCKKVIFIKNESEINLVYKSKHINSEPLVAQLFLEINTELKTDIFFCPKIYAAKNGYFSEYVFSENNDNLNEFLFSLGNLLVLVKLLGLSDLHDENILIKNKNYLW